MWVFIFLIFVHWLSDFVLQSRNMGERKGKDNFWLTLHVLVYSFATIFCWSLVFPLIKIPISAERMWLSFMIMFAAHWITDYITSRVTGNFYSQQRWYGFFTTIGFDQVLHYIQLFTIYNYIILNK
jgi:hypothetical protein